MVNDYEKVKKLLADFTTNSYIDQTAYDTAKTGYTVVRDVNYIKMIHSVVYTTGTSITINNDIDLVKLNASSSATLNTIVMNDVYDGKRISVLAWNGNTTIAHGGVTINGTNDNAFVLKGAVNITVPMSGSMDFIYMNNKWIETARSF